MTQIADVVASTNAKGETANPRLERARKFVQTIAELKDGDRGRFASLKRNAGNTIAESHGAMWFHRYLAIYASEYDQEIYFLVATLIPLGKHKFTGDFGKSMAALKTKKTNAESIDKRFQVLLDADFTRTNGMAEGGELAFRLRQLTKLLSSKEVGIDWAQLLVDLQYWSDPKKRVQKRWAQSYYAVAMPSDASLDTEDIASKENSL